MEYRARRHYLCTFMIIAAQFRAEREVGSRIQGETRIHQNIDDGEEQKVAEVSHPVRRAPEEEKTQPERESAGQQVRPAPTEARSRTVGEVADDGVIHPVPDPADRQG